MWRSVIIYHSIRNSFSAGLLPSSPSQSSSGPPFSMPRGGSSCLLASAAACARMPSWTTLSTAPCGSRWASSTCARSSGRSLAGEAAGAARCQAAPHPVSNCDADDAELQYRAVPTGENTLRSKPATPSAAPRFSGIASRIPSDSALSSSTRTTRRSLSRRSRSTRNQTMRSPDCTFTTIACASSPSRSSLLLAANARPPA